jgi:transketolase
MLTSQQLAGLTAKAAELRWRIVNMMGWGKAHHFGGSLSAADIVTALYFYKLRYDPADPGWPERDRFIMSKGHAVPAQYAALAMLGVFPTAELQTLKQLGSRLQGHPAMHLTPGLEGCTGALGEGLSYANGMALASRIQGRACRVYCLLGDGELHEGQVWEAAMTTARHCLNHVTAIVDRNRLKGSDEVDCGKLLEPLTRRWECFGWATRQVDGHDLAAICQALDWADTTRQPALIVARTVKGKGVSFMEGNSGFHNAPISEQQYRQAMAELEMAYRPAEQM